MAAVTAAVVAATATTAAAGMSAAKSAGALGGGGGGGGRQAPTVKNLPQNPQDQAIKDYNERLIMANEMVQPPSFQSVLQGGGSMSLAKMPLNDPGMTPWEAAAAGFVDRQGRPIPMVRQSDIGQVSSQGLSPQQTLMLAKERAQRATDYGGTVPGWAAQVTGRAAHINAVDQRIAALQGNPNANPNLIGRLQQKSATMKANQNKALGGSYYPPEENK